MENTQDILKDILKADILKVTEVYAASTLTEKLLIPHLETPVAAGFCSIAENSIDKVLDLNDLLIKHATATFFIRVQGNSMKDAGINSNDILIVDRALTASHNKIVIARVNEELTVKRLKLEAGKIFLVADNDDYKPLEITEGTDLEIWGVVTYVIHQV